MTLGGKVNKKTLILLLIAVIIWVVAIFVLIRMNSPNPQPVLQTAQQSVSTPTQGVQNQWQNPSLNQTENSSQVIAQNLSIVEIQNMIPDSTFTDMFKPYLLEIKFDKVSTGDSKFLSSRLKSTNSAFGEIEDISTAEFEYVGYLSISEGGKQRRKVYIRQGTDTKSFYDTEIIDNRYKIIDVREFEIILLDTYDGKIKKLSNLLAKQ
ncbi:hypothetical protein [Fervidobacterium nodosum]|uniref:Uncharacterized protein n=1 Tax=Fervidobacterium nodosum (strain ATCC 35602 / DSM 5306 / Rt17-B1) TaxID=381764 RepID=A7HMI0_FERNB|nr:hypothetical protein [Fervidobacterium nodosum]ABS61113.1 hypothetical protein Fnod_1266 [Fervidobacterium nodosum Rt17-B1]HOJ94604.1 hypothetical protein [Fervidobacterium nodosum]